MAIGFMASKLGENLARYMPFLQPVLIIGLKNIEEYQVIICDLLCNVILLYDMLC